jgi:ABC-type uncharacterized transport system involved in gliding motility auxiliary subunit
MRSQTLRRLTYGANVAVALVLAAALVVMANWLANKYPRRHDFVQTSDLYKLSEKTKSVLRALETNAHFYVFSNPQDSELYDKLERLLRAYQDVTPRVSFTMVDSIRDIARLRKLVRELSVDEPDTVVLMYGDQKKLLTEMDLADYRFTHDYNTGGQIKNLRTFKAEQAFTSALLELMHPVKLTARFTVKHGEKSIYTYGADGLSEARRFLQRDNLEAEPLELVTLHELSQSNCNLLIIAGPTKPLLEAEVNIVRRYLLQGGRAMVLLDPELKSGLEELLTEFNVKVGNNVVVDPERRLPNASPLQLVAGLYGDHPITRRLQTFTMFFLARSVSIRDPRNTVNVGDELIMTGRRGWGETRTDGDTFRFDEGEDLRGPVSVGVAVENQKSGLRLVVIGDADFITNREIVQGGNRDLFLSAANWLLKREFLVAVETKTVVEMKRLELNKPQLNIITLTVIGVVPALALAVGLMVWLLRRR